ncbi:YceI family protein [Runella zeae]|uniref:YceI family protein n=1 Tax=Runella zeae TaxID=94255 RepID=UPI000490BB2A|nr:YceI family protein [Runella zeae]
MKKVFFPALIALVISTSAFTVINNTTLWKVKEDTYSVKFTSKAFDGTFKGLESDLQFDENNLGASKLTASINANSINTGNGMRNGHAKKGLDAANFKTVKFVSTSIAKTAAGYEATGNLTIKDVTKAIKIPFTFNQNADGGVFAGTFSVKPTDYNVTRKGTPEVLNFQLSVPVTK